MMVEALISISDVRCANLGLEIAKELLHTYMLPATVELSHFVLSWQLWPLPSVRNNVPMCKIATNPRND